MFVMVCQQGQFGLSRPPSGQVSVNGTNSGTAVPSKTRIRWTQDLHDRFVECVSLLGGAESTYLKDYSTICHFHPFKFSVIVFL